MVKPSSAISAQNGPVYVHIACHFLEIHTGTYQYILAYTRLSFTIFLTVYLCFAFKYTDTYTFPFRALTAITQVKSEQSPSVSSENAEDKVRFQNFGFLFRQIFRKYFTFTARKASIKPYTNVFDFPQGTTETLQQR